MKIEMNDECSNAVISFMVILCIMVVGFLFRGCVQDEYKHIEHMKQFNEKVEIKK